MRNTTYFSDCLQYSEIENLIYPPLKPSKENIDKVVKHFKSLNLRFNNSTGQVRTSKHVLTYPNIWDKKSKYKRHENVYKAILKYEFMPWVNNGLSRLERGLEL